ncbi:hypothetical protein J4208_02675 [Candidatus Woesearchaeota archaeon]|nr:hypothetical protein [Candidatus Woesearchaeota archaeon]
MGKTFFNKRGFELSTNLIIVLILTVVFLIVTIPMITKVGSTSTRLSLQEWRCSFSLMLNQLPVFSTHVKPWCSTSIIKFNDKFIDKQRDKGETQKDAAMHIILDKMLTCKEMVGGPKAAGFISHQYCYICYSLETDKTTPFITEADLHSAALRMETASGLDYNTEFKKDGNTIVADLQGGIGINSKSSSGTLDTGKNYGITYVTVSRGSFSKLLDTAESFAGTCAAGVGIGFVVGWIVPVVGPIIGVSAASGICYVSLNVHATGYFLFDYFELGTDTGAIFLTDYKTLEKQRCDTVVSG